MSIHAEPLSATPAFSAQPLADPMPPVGAAATAPTPVAPASPRGLLEEVIDGLQLRDKVEQHPYAMVAAAFGIGYVLGGGLFTPTTARVIRLGVKLASLPIVQERVLGLAEAAVDELSRRNG